MRATALFMPTVKEDPADAEAISHKLMVRGGFVRQFASGIYMILPLGWRVMQRICASSAKRWMPSAPWRCRCRPCTRPMCGRHGSLHAIGPEMFRLEGPGGQGHGAGHDPRGGLHLAGLPGVAVLPRPSPDLVSVAAQVPRRARPKGGVLRVREFLMKDSYSFDLDETGLDVSYEKHIGAYDRIFERCGVEFYRVESDSGFMGGAAGA